jgi:hypothetical protein
MAARDPPGQVIGLSSEQVDQFGTHVSGRAGDQQHDALGNTSLSLVRENA